VPDLDPVRVWLDRFRACDRLVTDPFKEECLVLDLHPDTGMGVDDRGIFQVFEQAFTGCKGAFKLDLDTGAMGPVPGNFF